MPGPLYVAPTQTYTFPMTPVSVDSILAAFGIPANTIELRPSLPSSLTAEWIDCPFVAPRKRRGLTGKRYRIARRRHARNMRDWHRGLVAGIHRRVLAPRVVAGYDGASDGSGALTFSIVDHNDDGARIRDTWVDEVLG